MPTHGAPKNRIWAKNGMVATASVTSRAAKPYRIWESGVVAWEIVSGCPDRYNRQLHDDEQQAIHDAARGDKKTEEKLTQAACYRVQCWAQYSPKS
ncbi:MAG: hypothetical protein P4L87_18975, partial [Formivibrio sp.]|nr:hypothetical protein [Formivibrio sp.]